MKWLTTDWEKVSEILHDKGPISKINKELIII